MTIAVAALPDPPVGEQREVALDGVTVGLQVGCGKRTRGASAFWRDTEGSCSLADGW